MIKRVFLLTLMLFVCSMIMGNAVFAAPVNLPAALLNGGDDNSSGVSIGLEADVLNNRETDKWSGELEARIISVVVKGSLEPKFDVYGLLGQAMDVEQTTVELGSNIKYEFEDALIFGLGCTGVINEIDDEGLTLFTDLGFRMINDIDYEAITVDGVKYTNDQIGVQAEADFVEWQIALGIAKQFESFLPYGGIKYSDIDVSSQATAGGSTYTTDEKAKNNVGIFLGCAWLSEKDISLDVEIRFIDEQAFTGRFSYKF